MVVLRFCFGNINGENKVVWGNQEIGFRDCGGYGSYIFTRND